MERTDRDRNEAMISRRTSQALADVYERLFYTENSIGIRICNATALYDFLYANDYEPYLMNIAKQTRGDLRNIKEFIMRLHTGETIYALTTEWDSKEREKLGNRLLCNLAE